MKNPKKINIFEKCHFPRFWEHFKKSTPFEMHHLNEPKWGHVEILEAHNHVLRACKWHNTAHSCCIHCMRDVQHHMSRHNFFSGSQWVDLVPSRDVSQENDTLRKCDFGHVQDTQNWCYRHARECLGRGNALTWPKNHCQPTHLHWRIFCTTLSDRSNTHTFLGVIF